LCLPALLFSNLQSHQEDCDITHKLFGGDLEDMVAALGIVRVPGVGGGAAIGIGIGAVIGIRLQLDGCRGKRGRAKCAIYNLSGIKVSYNGATCHRTCRASVNFFYARKEQGPRMGQDQGTRGRDQGVACKFDIHAPDMAKRIRQVAPRQAPPSETLPEFAFFGNLPHFGEALLDWRQNCQQPSMAGFY